MPRNVGRKAAIELILTGRTFDANEALRLGLINRTVPGSELLEASRALRPYHVCELDWWIMHAVRQTCIVIRLVRSDYIRIFYSKILKVEKIGPLFCVSVWFEPVSRMLINANESRGRVFTVSCESEKWLFPIYDGPKSIEPLA